MDKDLTIRPIAYFHSPFASKFGVPKQSSLVDELEGYIEFVADCRNADMLRGIEDFDYLWLVWHFSANPHGATSPLVRPPLLGGNRKVGVFASRSPFRPNALGLRFTPRQLVALRKVLELDPRPHYHNDVDKLYGMPFLGYDIKFRVDGDRLIVVRCE